MDWHRLKFLFFAFIINFFVPIYAVVYYYLNDDSSPNNLFLGVILYCASVLGVSKWWFTFGFAIVLIIVSIFSLGGLKLSPSAYETICISFSALYFVEWFIRSGVRLENPAPGLKANVTTP